MTPKNAKIALFLHASNDKIFNITYLSSANKLFLSKIPQINLNPLDYFWGGFLKAKVYTPWPRNLDELEANIRREVANLQPAMVARALMDIKSRARKCLNAGGGHFEC